MNEQLKDMVGLTAITPEQAETEAKYGLTGAREYDLVSNLLQMADFRNSAEEITDVEIRRNGEVVLVVHLKPLGSNEISLARKKARKMIPNPNGRKLPKIEGDFNTELFHSWLIYLATTDEDKEKIWGNKQLAAKCDLMEPVEAVDTLLKIGEKSKLVDTVIEISGYAEEDEDDEEYAKN